VEAPRQTRSELIGLLVTLAGLRLAPTAVVTALRRHPMIEDLLRESGMVELWRQEGEREMAQQMARVALEGKFGPLSAELLAALEQADTATLQAVVAHLTTDTLEQVRARLGR
jgi:hypothetical protein